jgi:hypothetical protein
MLLLRLCGLLSLSATEAFVLPAEPSRPCALRISGARLGLASPDGREAATPPPGYNAQAPSTMPEEEEVAPPPVYPDGLPEAAKADRRGPFWSSLGEPDVSTGVRPNFLRRDDWHISSTYTPAELAEAEAAEAAHYAEVQVPAEELEVEAPEDADAWDPFAELEYMRTEGVVASGATKSPVPMPQTWQQYQFIQEQLASYANDGALTQEQRARALCHVAELNDFYETFKAVLSCGWTLLNNTPLEAAGRFLLDLQGSGEARAVSLASPDADTETYRE